MLECPDPGTIWSLRAFFENSQLAAEFELEHGRRFVLGCDHYEEEVSRPKGVLHLVRNDEDEGAVSA